VCASAAAVSAPSLDGRSSHLVDLTRHCLAVRPRRRGTAYVADITRRTAGGRSAGLLARSWTICGQKCWRHLTIVVPLLMLPLLTVGGRDVNVIYIHSETPPCLSQQGSMSLESQPGSR